MTAKYSNYDGLVSSLKTLKSPSNTETLSLCLILQPQTITIIQITNYCFTSLIDSMSSDLYSFATTFHSHSTSEHDGTQDLPFLSDSFPFFNNTPSNPFDEPLLPSLDPFSPSFFSFSPPTDQNLTSYHQTDGSFSDFDLSQVKNEDSSSQISVDYYNNNQFLPHSYSAVESVSKYMQRSFSSNSFENKPSFLFQTHRDNLMDSPKFQMHDLSSSENSLRRVCSTGDLQNMKENNMSPKEGNSQEESNFKVGRYSAEERKEKISKYRAKRTQRNFNKTIKYACRKTLADNRPRVRGRFARNDEPNEIPKVPCRDEDEVDFWMEELSKNKVSVIEMRMLRWMCGNTRDDKIKNDNIREYVGVTPIIEKTVENRLRWFGHVERRHVDSLERRVNQMERSQTTTGRGRCRKTIREIIKKDLEINDLDRT